MAPRMAFRSARPYLALAGLGLGVAGAVAGSGLATAQPLFQGTPLNPERVIALAQPLAGNRWNLVLLEQLQAGVNCWQRLADGSVLNMADGVRNETFCGRYGSSSAYSLRVGGSDLSSPWRLRLEAGNDRLELQATSPQSAAPILVASAPLPTGSGGGAFTPLELEPGWALERRSFNGRPLNHLYLSNGDPLPALIARASGSVLTAPPLMPPPLLTAAAPRGRDRNRPPLRGPGQASGAATAAGQQPLLGAPRRLAGEPQPGEVIALQVVPFSD